MSKLHQIFRACYLSPWFDPPQERVCHIPSISPGGSTGGEVYNLQLRLIV